MKSRTEADQEQPTPPASTERDCERWLDSALADTFPASDPVASNVFD